LIKMAPEDTGKLFQLPPLPIPTAGQMNFRPITAGDVERLFEIRERVRENVLTRTQLADMGITPQSTTEALQNELAGYLCEVAGSIVGFSMANLETQEIAVIAVLSEFEGHGIGRELLRLSEEILWRTGARSIWLWTSTNRHTRAVQLYFKAGWREKEVQDDRLYLWKEATPPTPLRSEG